MENNWKAETIKALEKLGGIGHLNDIFDVIVKNGRIDFSVSKTPKKTLSRVLQTYSYSTEYGIEDTFYSVYGIENKKGVWALSSYRTYKNIKDDNFDKKEFPEGSLIARKHYSRERNKKLISLAKNNFKEQNNGRIFCEVCGFDFFETYGELGEDFIEAHHIIPVSKLNDTSKTKIEDICMVCSNCHSMLHRRRPWIDKDELKSILKQ